MTSIGRYAFDGCNGLKSITIPDGVTSIGEGAFKGCSGLTRITIPDGLTSIGRYAFEGCSGLTSITIPDSVTYIGYNAFAYCRGLTSVTIGKGVKTIDIQAFHCCEKLVEVINKSSLDIEKGSESNGGVGYYALTIKTSEDSEIVNEDGYLFYTIDNVNYLVGYTGNDIDLTLPESYNGNTYEIREYAFWFCANLTSVIIPDSVTSIGLGAFYGCSGLTSITIGSGVTSIVNAFENCGALTSINVSSDNIKYHSKGNCLIETESKTLVLGCANSIIPTDGSVTSIGDFAFEGCGGLKSITIPDSVTSIGSFAFRGCSGLTSVTIGNGVTSIGSYAFDGCSGLENIYITDIAAWCNISGLNGLMSDGSSNKKLYLNNVLITDLVIPDGVTSIGYEAFRGCSELTSITIPDGVTSIGYEAFRGCSELTSITIPDSVTSIGRYVFSDCSGITSVTIGKGVTYIGSSVFSGCTNLTSVTISDSVTWIEWTAFDGCRGLENIYITDIAAWCNISGLNGLMRDGSSNKKLYLNNELVTDLVIPDGVTSIGDYAFYNCSGLTSVIIPDSVTSIGSSAFEGCKNLKYNEYKNALYLGNDDNPYVALVKTKTTSITSCEINNKTKIIYYFAFRDCSGLKSITIPDGVTSIGSSAFSGCSGLTSVTIGNGVTSIGHEAFSGCSGLKSITIPDAVTYIGYYAFEGCSSLETVYYAGTSEQWGNISMNDWSNSYLTSATRYYYSETEPELTEDGTAYNGSYWHYDEDGVTPVIWKKALRNS